MSERSKYRVAQKRRLLTLRNEVERLASAAKEKRELQAEIPAKSYAWIKLNRDCQQLERRVVSYRLEIENTAETVAEIKANPEEKIARPGHKTSGGRARTDQS